MKNRIKEYRQNKGLSQEALAKMIGVRVQQVSSWERGALTPKLHHALALARALGTTVEELWPIRE